MPDLQLPAHVTPAAHMIEAEIANIESHFLVPNRETGVRNVVDWTAMSDSRPELFRHYVGLRQQARIFAHGRAT